MRGTRKYLAIAAGLAVAVVISVSAVAQDSGQPNPEALAKLANKKPGYSPYAGRNYPTRAFWGDTHVHTSTSFDAGAFGSTLGPRDAYRFARGDEVISNSGQRVKMGRPLDFLAVTDHSDNMGFFPDLMAGKQKILANPTGRKWYDMVRAGKGADVGIEAFFALFQGTYPKELMYNPATGEPIGVAWAERRAEGARVERGRRVHVRVAPEHTRRVVPSRVGRVPRLLVGYLRQGRRIGLPGVLCQHRHQGHSDSESTRYDCDYYWSIFHGR